MPILPEPSLDERSHSEKVTQHIRQIIQQSGDKIPFHQFMELALYAPTLGYYHVGTPKFGSSGDFITAPELSPLFGACLARQCEQILTLYQEGDILELGAGTGKLAAAILTTLEKSKKLPKNYYILEISPDLKERQQTYFTTYYPHLFHYITWLDSLPEEKITGLILANEVMDAIPVDRFEITTAGLQEYFVGWDNISENFIWRLDTPRNHLAAMYKSLFLEHNKNLPQGYISELNTLLPAWIKTLGDSLADGMILLIDYGYSRAEYYLPDRQEGTLACHYKHHYHHNPLILCGIQDICAHVDFTLVAESAISANLEISGFTNQASFLLSCGLAELAGYPLDAQTKRAIQTLILPAEMGEAFKVIALTRNIDTALLGFNLQDMRYKL